MAKKELNPGSAFDPWFGVLLLLGISTPVARLVYPLLPMELGLPQAPAKSGSDMLDLGALAILIVAFFVVRARAEKSLASRAILRAFMALAGGVVILMLSVSLAATGLGLLVEVLPHWVPHPAVGFLLVVLCGGAFFLACYWSGWRYGAGGPFWGAGAALLCLAAFILPAVVKGGLRVGAWEVAVALAAILVGALAGTLGAAHFQRGLAKEAATAPGTAAPSTHPAA